MNLASNPITNIYLPHPQTTQFLLLFRPRGSLIEIEMLLELFSLHTSLSPTNTINYQAFGRNPYHEVLSAPPRF